MLAAGLVLRPGCRRGEGRLIAVPSSVSARPLPTGIEQVLRGVKILVLTAVEPYSRTDQYTLYKLLALSGQGGRQGGGERKVLALISTFENVLVI